MNTIILKINLYQKTVQNVEDQDVNICNAHYLTFNTELNRVEFYKKIFKNASHFQSFETIYNRNIDHWCTDNLTNGFKNLIINKCGAILPTDGTWFSNFPVNMFFGFEEVESVKFDEVEL